MPLLQLPGAQSDSGTIVNLTPGGTLWHGAMVADCQSLECGWADSRAKTAAARLVQIAKLLLGAVAADCPIEHFTSNTGVQTVLAACRSVDSA